MLLLMRESERGESDKLKRIDRIVLHQLVYPAHSKQTEHKTAKQGKIAGKKTEYQM